MIIEWLSNLPIWAILIWFFGGGILYPLGIELTKKYQRVFFLGISVIALITTYTTMQLMAYDIRNEPVVQVFLILIIASLALLMVKWSHPEPVASATKSKDGEGEE